MGEVRGPTGVGDHREPPEAPERPNVRRDRRGVWSPVSTGSAGRCLVPAHW